MRPQVSDARQGALAQGQFSLIWSGSDQAFEVRAREAVYDAESYARLAPVIRTDLPVKS